MNALEKLRARLKELSVDAILVLDEHNQRYLTGFHFSDGVLFVTDSEAHILTDFRYKEAALKVVSGEFTVTVERDRLTYINNVITRVGIARFGFEGGTTVYSDYCRYRDAFSGVELVDVGGEIEKIREIKTKEEITKIRKAQEITDIAFSHVLKMLKPNMTEIEVAAELEYAMRRAGADGTAFDTIAVSGDASALPHGVPRNVKLKKGFLTMDFGAKLDGYCSDMTRTVVIGHANDEMKALYNTVLAAQNAALSYLRDGADAGEADRVAREIIDSDSRFAGSFGHALGHSVGLFIHESPSLSSRGRGVALGAGQVVTVEPGIYLFEKHGCRIEDMVVIEKNGVENLTRSTKELIEIC